MLFHYDGDGKPIGSFIPRSEFPVDAQSTLEGPTEGGAPALGLTEDAVWFWLPGSQRLTVLNKDGTQLGSYLTGRPGMSTLPQPDSTVHPEVVGATLLPDGRLLAQAVVAGPDGHPRSGIYAWTQSEDWQQFDHPEGSWLLGATSRELLLGYRTPSPAIIRIGSMPLP
jgi:hypothetical protein